MPEIVEEQFVAAMTSFEEAGYERVVLMSGGNMDGNATRQQAAWIRRRRTGAGAGGAIEPLL